MNFAKGDRVRFKDREEVHRLHEEGKIVYGWNDEMDHLCGMEFIISRILGNKVSFEGDPKEVHGWIISTSMLDFSEDNREAAEAIMADDHLFDMVMC